MYVRMCSELAQCPAGKIVRDSPWQLGPANQLARHTQHTRACITQGIMGAQAAGTAGGQLVAVAAAVHGCVSPWVNIDGMEIRTEKNSGTSQSRTADELVQTGVHLPD